MGGKHAIAKTMPALKDFLKKRNRAKGKKRKQVVSILPANENISPEITAVTVLPFSPCFSKK